MTKQNYMQNQLKHFNSLYLHSTQENLGSYIKNSHSPCGKFGVSLSHRECWYQMEYPMDTSTWIMYTLLW